MVLRGSATKPDMSINEALQELQDAKQRLAEATAHYEEALRMAKLHQPAAEAAKKSASSELSQAVVEGRESRENLVTTVKQFAAGGMAGAIARTCVAPIDRVKILMQTQFVSKNLAADSATPKYTGVVQSLRTILREEGVARLWRGNLTNIARVAPYSATQFGMYDFIKRKIFVHRFGTATPSKAAEPGAPKQEEQKLRTAERLIAGALAGTAATTITHPLDVIRLRLSVQRELTGAFDAARCIMAEGGAMGFFKGYIPTVVSLAPFIAINFATFDFFKATYSLYSPVENRGSTEKIVATLTLGAAAGIVAQTFCYPLDLIRRRMQLPGKVYNGTFDAFRTILAKEGPRGFYKGMLPNTIKVIPNNAIRFLAYDAIKSAMGISGSGGSGGD